MSSYTMDIRTKCEKEHIMGVQPLFNPNDSLTGRDGGPYLDLEEARVAEARRAVVENREPSSKPPATAGIPLIPASELINTGTINNVPSQDAFIGSADLAIKGAVEDSNVLLQPASERDLDALNTPHEGAVDPTEFLGESLSELGISNPEDK